MRLSLHLFTIFILAIATMSFKLTPKELNFIKKEAPITNTEKIIEIKNLEQFKRILKRTDKVVYVDAYTPSCHPCIELEPVFESWAEDNYTKALFLKVNVLKVEGFKEFYSIKKIPTLLIFNEKGNLENQITSLPPIQNYIESH